MDEWSIADNHVAEKEGWAIFNADTEPEIQRIDETALFPSDEAAWDHVVDKALVGSAVHERALRFIRENNEGEWAFLIDYLPKAMNVFSTPRVVDLSGIQTDAVEPDNSGMKPDPQKLNIALMHLKMARDFLKEGRGSKKALKLIKKAIERTKQ